MITARSYNRPCINQCLLDLEAVVITTAQTSPTIYVVISAYTSSSIYSTTGGCFAGSGSTVVLPAPYSIFTTTVAGNMLAQDVANDFGGFLDSPKCLVNAHIAPITSAILLTPTRVTAPVVVGTESAITAIETSPPSSPTATPQSNGRYHTVMVTVSIAFSVISAIAILIGVFLIRRRRKRLRHAQVDVNNPTDSDSKQTNIYLGKP